MDKGIKAKTKSIPPPKKIWGARESGRSAAYRVGEPISKLIGHEVLDKL